MLHEKSEGAWYQKSCDLRHNSIICYVGKRLVWNWSCSRLPVHSRHLFYAYLESEMIILQHFIHYKALPFTCCKQQCSVSDWLFASLRLIFTLHMDNTGHATSDTRPSHFSRATLKSWEGPKDKTMFIQHLCLATTVWCDSYNVTAILCCCILSLIIPWQ